MAGSAGVINLWYRIDVYKRQAVECPGLKAEKGCKGADVCVTKYVWQRINDSITAAVDDIDLQQLVEESKKTSKNGQPANPGCEN